MSTYNGEKYIQEQIESIFSQKEVNVDLFIRDDGSTDTTIKIIEDYINKGKRIVLIKGDNIGCEQSYWELLIKVSLDYQFYFFADQDDVWFDDKIIESIKKIIRYNVPALYSCNQIVTDKNLSEKEMIISFNQYEKLLKKMENNYLLNRHGCTLGWNNDLQKILGRMKHGDNYVPIHDKWVTLIARCCGTVIVDFKPFQYYRVHNSNTSGVEDNQFRRLKKGVRLYMCKSIHMDCYVRDVIGQLGDLIYSNSKNEAISFLENVEKYKYGLSYKLRIVFSKQFRDYCISDRLFWIICVFLEKY